MRKSIYYEDYIESPYPYWSVGRHELYNFKELIIDTQPTDTFDDMLSMSKSYISTNIGENLLTMKINNNQIVTRIYNNGRLNYNISYDITRAHFLSIVYKHPDMRSTIIIDIPSSVYLVGNEILSSVFVKRYLEYLNVPFVFDNKYTLEIMDSKIHTFILKSDQYILLGADEYYTKTKK